MWYSNATSSTLIVSSRPKDFAELLLYSNDPSDFLKLHTGCKPVVWSIFSITSSSEEFFENNSPKKFFALSIVFDIFLDNPSIPNVLDDLTLFLNAHPAAGIAHPTCEYARLEDGIAHPAPSDTQDPI